MFFIPLRTVLYGMEMLVGAMRGLQDASDRGLTVLAGSETDSEGESEATVISNDAANSGKENEVEEIKRMDDKNLQDDMLKLVRYKILFVKRDREYAFPEQEELVPDNIDGSAYTAWKIAQFIQSLALKETHVPRMWKRDYPKEGRHRADVGDHGPDILLGFPEDDKKYLRVYYQVLERYKREELKYHEDQLQVLREIRDRI